MYHKLVDAHLRTRAERADHDLPHHLPVRSVHLETEHVRSFISISEPQVEITDRLRSDEGHGDLADSLEVEAQVGERSGEEAGGSFLVESVVAHLVQNGDWHGWVTPQVVSPCIWHSLARGLSVVGIAGVFRVFDARPEETYQRLADGLPRFVDVVHGKPALVELAVLELPPDRIGHH